MKYAEKIERLRIYNKGQKLTERQLKRFLTVKQFEKALNENVFDKEVETYADRTTKWQWATRVYYIVK